MSSCGFRSRLDCDLLRIEPFRECFAPPPSIANREKNSYVQCHEASNFHFCFPIPLPRQTYFNFLFGFVRVYRCCAGSSCARFRIPRVAEAGATEISELQKRTG